MKKILICLFILVALSLTAICVKTFAQSSGTDTKDTIISVNVPTQFTEEKQDSIRNSTIVMDKIHQEIFLEKIIYKLVDDDSIEPKDLRKKTRWIRMEGVNGGNEYKISMQISKTGVVKFFFFYIVEGDTYTSFRYWPVSQNIFILIFSFKIPEQNFGFDEWDFWDFEELFTEADYINFPKKLKPKKVWVKVPEIGIVPTSVMENLIEISDKNLPPK